MSMNSKIKIVYVITSTGVGGAEKILCKTVMGMDYNKYNLSICSLKKKGEKAKELEKHGITVDCLNMANKEGVIGWLTSIIALVRLYSYLKKREPLIVHSFLFRANILARVAGYLVGVPIIISSVRVMGGEKCYYHCLERMTSFMVDHYVSVSEGVKEYIIKKSKIRAHKISVIYNGIEVRRVNSVQVRSGKFPFEIKDGDRVVVAVGRLHKQKGYRYLLQAIARVGVEVPRVKLIIVGEGEEENNLKNLVKLLDLTSKIIFAGLRDDVEMILERAELFVLPSLWEGMPNVLLEAMIAGKPVIATDVGGISEVVINGETGVLVAPKDSDALANAILNLFKDKMKAENMGKAAGNRVEKHFSISGTLEKTENLYRELLKEKQLP